MTKRIIFLKLLIISLILISCSNPTLRFDQTCITCIKSQRFLCSGDECPKTFKVGDNLLVTMTETGENIYLTNILLAEKLPLKEGIPIAIAKINGKIFLTGDSFNNLWILYPRPKNEASYEAIKLPEAKIVSPVFELFTSKLMLSAQNYSHKYLFDDEKNKWIIHGALKGKE